MTSERADLPSVPTLLSCPMLRALADAADLDYISGCHRAVAARRGTGISVPSLCVTVGTIRDNLWTAVSAGITGSQNEA